MLKKIKQLVDKFKWYLSVAICLIVLYIFYPIIASIISTIRARKAA